MTNGTMAEQLSTSTSLELCSGILYNINTRLLQAENTQTLLGNNEKNTE